MTTPIPERWDLLRAARLCRWPRRTLAGRVVRGEAGWEEIAWRATPAERATILRRLGHRELLVVTPGGRAKLRRWLDRRWAGEWDASTPAEPPIFGDESFVPIVHAALAAVPAPVRAWAIESVYVITVGHSMSAWTSPPLRGIEGRWPIVLGPTAGVETLVHEVAHGWVSPPQHEGLTAPCLADREAILAHARCEGWPVHRVVEGEAEEHRIVRLLEAAWSPPSVLPRRRPRRGYLDARPEGVRR